ncbi:thioredoxin reductase 1, cytoplasmic-like [Mustela lutreola]|uniref:thioredoxin reductase 1, cytoplasmic-like n=1 Tax=Mustela lutreola TaxID=9666 RepID=UPI0027978D66|nr:thioredoxin reductase 1, cytoplasmic-like [Mustela lutreola]
MGCGKSKKLKAAVRSRSEVSSRSRPGIPSPAKDHLPSQPLPANPATGVSGPSGSSGPGVSDPRARLRAYIDSHPVVIFSKSTCKRCAEVKKLFKSMCVPYFLLELDQAVSIHEGYYLRTTIRINSDQPGLVLERRAPHPKAWH